jgi:hypothetical protein
LEPVKLRLPGRLLVLKEAEPLPDHLAGCLIPPRGDELLQVGVRDRFRVVRIAIG